MLNKIAEKDSNNQNLIWVNKQADFWSKLIDEQLMDIVAAFQKFVKDKYFVKKDTIEFCLRELKKAEREAEKRAVMEIVKFQKIKKRMKLAIEMKGDDLDGDEDAYQEKLMNELGAMENRLMDIEMSLQNVLIEATKEFAKKIVDINNDLKEKTTNFV